MTRERIDLEKLNDDLQHGNPEVDISDLITALKRCYEKIDWLMEIFPKSWCIECGNFLGKGELKPLQSNQIDECDHT